MKEIIAVINQKGGVAKTTTSHALATGLTKIGFRVLSVDLDAQGNLSLIMNADKQSDLSAINVLTNECNAQEAIQHTKQGDIIPANSFLAGADLKLNEVVGKEYRLKKALATITEDYDYVIIDTPPTLGTLTINALTAATGIVIPVQADEFSLHGMAQLHETITAVREYTNPKLKIKGVLLTRHNQRTVLNRDMANMIEEASKEIGTDLYETHIRECIALKEAQAMRQSIFDYAPDSNASKDYHNFVTELLEEAI